LTCLDFPEESTVVAVGIASKGRLTAEHVAVGCFEGSAPNSSQLNEALQSAVEQVMARTGWKGRRGQQGEVEIRRAGGRRQIVGLWGLGPEKAFDRSRLESWLTSVARSARANGAPRLAIVLPPHGETQGEDSALRIGQHLMLSEYRFDRYRERKDLKGGKLGKVLLLPPPGQESLFRASLGRVQAVSSAVAFARDLGNTPPSDATPIWMEEQAREALDGLGFEVEVFGPEKLEELGMGGILGVGVGSANPPRLVRLTWGSEGPVVALVGKGVTFDSGGLSLKPPASMFDMKYDKCGACTILATAQAVAELDLPVQLRVYLPLAENMPDGAAYRPSDIVRCYNGKTVEIVNTDAEGRLLLADAIALAVEEKPDHLLEYSTLTGGAIVALGFHGAALYTPDDNLAEELLEASVRTGERLWRMPLWAEYSDDMKGNHADLRNSGGRWGSAGTAAGFLAAFTGKFKRWAHVDIAGTAHRRTAGGDSREGGATGFGVALAVEWVRRISQ